MLAVALRPSRTGPDRQAPAAHAAISSLAGPQLPPADTPGLRSRRPGRSGKTRAGRPDLLSGFRPGAALRRAAPSPPENQNPFMTGVPRIPPMPVSCQPAPPGPPIPWSPERPGCPAPAMTRPWTSVERSAPAAMLSRTPRHARVARGDNRGHRRRLASSPWRNPPRRNCHAAFSASFSRCRATEESCAAESPDRTCPACNMPVLPTRFSAGRSGRGPSVPAREFSSGRSRVPAQTGLAFFATPGRSRHRLRSPNRRTVCHAARTRRRLPSCRPGQQPREHPPDGNGPAGFLPAGSSPAASPFLVRPAYHG